MPSPIIASMPGPVLDAPTRELFRRLNPVGYILFKRNCVDEAQLKNLCADLRALTPAEPLIFIDQEGGAVNRIDWLPHKGLAGREMGRLYEQDPALGLRVTYLNAFLLAAHLHPYGINVNCLPVADVAFPQTHDVIGARAFSHKPEVVAALAKATCRGLLAGGCWPIIKHAPGHGRAMADSHKTLPVVDASLADLVEKDFYPFKENADCPLVMTAHILYPQIDPAACATQSVRVVTDVLRGHMGLQGLVVSDDLYMEALTGDIPTRAAASLAAGCDLLLVCAGIMADLEKLASMNLCLSPEAAARVKTLPERRQPSTHEVEAATAELARIYPVEAHRYAV